jgi:hypothetical protein
MLEELAGRLHAAADALDEVEAGWLRGAANLVERGGPGRQAARAEAVWLEELASEARARKASLLSAWVEAAESLRSAIHVHETERGPLVEALFPVWKGASLRRHVDQALAAEGELQRRLTSAYVLRRLAELTTQTAVGPALEALAAAGAAWAAERERPALSGAGAEAVRTKLLAVAQDGALLLERVRWVVRAALVHRPELVEAVFPKRGRPAELESASAEGGAVDAPAPETVAAARPDSGASTRLPEAVEATPAPGPSPRRKKSAPDGAVVGPAGTTSARRRPAAPPSTPPGSRAARAQRRRPGAAEPASSEPHPSPRTPRRSAAASAPAAAEAVPSSGPAPRPRKSPPDGGPDGRSTRSPHRKPAAPVVTPPGGSTRTARHSAAASAPAAEAVPSSGPTARRRKSPPDGAPGIGSPASTRSPHRKPAAPLPTPRGAATRTARHSAAASTPLAAEADPSPGPSPRRRKSPADRGPGIGSTHSPRRKPAAPLPTPPADAARPARRRPAPTDPSATPTPSEPATSPRAGRRATAEPKAAAVEAVPSPGPASRPRTAAPAAPDAAREPARRGGRKTSRSSRRS